MFVVKATLKDETRRLSFEGSKFPSYGDVQKQVRMVINVLREVRMVGREGGMSDQLVNGARERPWL